MNGGLLHTKVICGTENKGVGFTQELISVFVQLVYFANMFVPVFIAFSNILQESNGKYGMYRN